MRVLKSLFDNNRAWAASRAEADPSFFPRLAAQQTPRYLWIGCADSRVPANEIVGLDPGELFVHRNVANLVVHTDFNCLSVLQYAVEVLKVQHVIVCGHYGCGGVQAALQNQEFGLIDNWLRHIKDLYHRLADEVDRIEDSTNRLNKMCELNVIEQVYNVSHTPIVQRAWRDGQALAVHGWIYGLGDGLLRDLDMCITSPDEIRPPYRITVG